LRCVLVTHVQDVAHMDEINPMEWAQLDSAICKRIITALEILSEENETWATLAGPAAGQFDVGAAYGASRALAIAKEILLEGSGTESEPTEGPQCLTDNTVEYEPAEIFAPVSVPDDDYVAEVSSDVPLYGREWAGIGAAPGPSAAMECVFCKETFNQRDLIDLGVCIDWEKMLDPSKEGQARGDIATCPLCYGELNGTMDIKDTGVGDNT